MQTFTVIITDDRRNQTSVIIQADSQKDATEYAISLISGIKNPSVEIICTQFMEASYLTHCVNERITKN